MTWDAQSVRHMRAAFGVTRAGFAKIVGVDVRTVNRWEYDIAKPSGAPEAILNAFRERLTSDPGGAPALISYVKEAAGVGGLSYLLLKLLGDALPMSGSKPA